MAAVTDFEWKCKSCDEVVAYKDRDQHLQCMHETVSLEVDSLFTKIVPSDEKFHWKCNHCSRNVLYSAMEEHVRSEIHRKDNLIVGLVNVGLSIVGE